MFGWLMIVVISVEYLMELMEIQGFDGRTWLIWLGGSEPAKLVMVERDQDGV